MNEILIKGSRLQLPRTIDGVELAPGSGRPFVEYDIGAAVVQVNDGSTFALGLIVGQQRFCSLFVSVESARAIATRILEITKPAAS